MDGPAKLCRACGRLLPLAAFYRQRTMADGHANDCKVCASKRNRAYYKAHPEVRRRWSRMHRALTRDVAEHEERVAKKRMGS